MVILMTVSVFSQTPAPDFAQFPREAENYPC